MSEVGFDELFVVEYPRLVALGVAMSGDREVARDLAQETMLRAHRRWDDVRAYDRPSAWLRRVMANLLIDHHRACTSERTAVGRLGRTVLDSAPEPPLPSRWDELVAPLTANQRLIATLYYAEDCSIGEIADVVVFLCSGGASFMTGSQVVVDGGPLWPEPSTVLKLVDDEIEVLREGQGALPE